MGQGSDTDATGNSTGAHVWNKGLICVATNASYNSAPSQRCIES